MKPIARQQLESPHQSDHVRSITSRMDTGRMPRSLSEFVNWYRDAWAQETPVRLHAPGVWRDHGLHAQGGSRLGSPRMADAFRRYIHNSARETDPDGYYSRPIHAALARLERKYPIMARRLFRLAAEGFDWQRTSDAFEWAPEDGAVYFETALRYLWLRYDEQARERVA